MLCYNSPSWPKQDPTEELWKKYLEIQHHKPIIKSVIYILEVIKIVCRNLGMGKIRYRSYPQIIYDLIGKIKHINK